MCDKYFMVQNCITSDEVNVVIGAEERRKWRRETDNSRTRGRLSMPDVIAAKKSANVAADDPTLVTRRSIDAGGRFRPLPDQDLPDCMCL